jgi:hypothetical protein
MQMGLLIVHSWLRWVILLVAAVALVKLVVGLAGKREFDRMTGGLMAAFSGLMDLQVVIGVVQLIVGWRAYSAAAGGFPLPQIEHLGVMLVAAVIAHLPARWKSKPDAIRYRNTLIVLVVALVLIVVGVSTLAGSRWVFRGL